MKLTDDIVRAIQKSIENSFESVSDFARFANVSANTVTRYLNKETESIKEDTWKKLYPLIKNFLPRKSSSHHKPLELTTDEKILVDAFKDLPSDIQRQKLMEILDLARKVNKKKAKAQEEEKAAK
ncbi:MAG: LacI family DNA-binding transcriptional regulator [Lentisphaeria bacterium]|nr:LacI family DNA-binding transcriptional regulator [Lentisphaeria bacterium]